MTLTPVVWPDPSPDQIAELRSMIAEPDDTTFSDQDLATILWRFTLIDTGGYEPVLTDGSLNPLWTATYDVYAAAGNLWSKKQAAVAALYDFTADGGSWHRSQQFDQYGKMARKYSAMAAPISLRVHIPANFERDWEANPLITPLDFREGQTPILPSFVVNAPETSEPGDE